ncbi:hypothetical protein [Bowmanella denitrificans]|uniref:hypothetical protein n=1 Tax=Bowmanella denitrificans TaxID=366582 RepID=UPI001FE43AFF|nr:hypothetical protein [Bowmanella denitrificans]
MAEPEMKAEVPQKWGQERRGWHLDKTISVGHLLSTVIIAIPVFTWVATVDKRIEQNALAISYLVKEVNETKQRSEALRIELKGDLAVISGKLDRLIERQAGM